MRAERQMKRRWNMSRLDRAWAKVTNPWTVVFGFCQARAPGCTVLANVLRRICWSAILSLMAVAVARTTFAQSTIECSPLGGSVLTTLSGWSADTCPPAVSISVSQDRIDILIDPTVPPGEICGATVTYWCHTLNTGPLADGTYHVYVTTIPDPPALWYEVAVNCTEPHCTAQPLRGDSSGLNGPVRVVC